MSCSYVESWDLNPGGQAPESILVLLPLSTGTIYIKARNQSSFLAQEKLVALTWFAVESPSSLPELPLSFCGGPDTQNT